MMMWWLDFEYCIWYSSFLPSSYLLSLSRNTAWLLHLDSWSWPSSSHVPQRTALQVQVTIYGHIYRQRKLLLAIFLSSFLWIPLELYPVWCQCHRFWLFLFLNFEIYIKNSQLTAIDRNHAMKLLCSWNCFGSRKSTLKLITQQTKFCLEEQRRTWYLK